MKERQLNHDETMKRRELTPSRIPIKLYIDDVQLEHNIAGIFRLADIFAVEEIIFAGNNQFIFSKKFRSISRSNKGNIKFSVLEPQKGLELLINNDEKYTIIGIEYTTHSDSIQSLRLTSPSFIVMGSETHGISEAVLEVCQRSFHIDMYGSISSLNICTALAIALHECRR